MHRRKHHSQGAFMITHKLLMLSSLSWWLGTTCVSGGLIGLRTEHHKLRPLVRNVEDRDLGTGFGLSSARLLCVAGWGPRLPPCQGRFAGILGVFVK